MIHRTKPEPAQVVWRRRLRAAVEHANAALRAGQADRYSEARNLALRAANALRKAR